MPPALFNLQDRTALVTGASSGFGAHFCRVLAAHGARVVACARRLDRLEELVGEISAGGGEALAVAMDVTDAASVAAAFDAAETAFGTVTIISNNAGVADARLAVQIDEESYDRVLDTNLKGAWLVAREAGRRMIKAGSGGSIVNTASLLGLRVTIGQSTYAISKAGVVQMTRALALEWARKGIRVNALCPGYFITDMNRDFLTSDRGKAYIATTPAQRTGELEELTTPFLLLASDAGSFINGVALPVDGGHALGAT